MGGGPARWSASPRPSSGSRATSPGEAIRPGARSAWARSSRRRSIVAAFLVNKNIYNSDNYRYLIFLLTAWSLGFGLCLDDLSSAGSAGGWRPG